MGDAEQRISQLAPLQTFYLLSILVILPLAWIRGGHAERAGAMVLLLSYAAGPFMADFRLGRVMIGYTATDLALLAALAWLTWRHDRWWLLFAASAQMLSVVSHLSLWLNPTVTPRENVAIMWVFGLFVLYSLLVGVGERWLAGETAAAPPL